MNPNSQYSLFTVTIAKIREFLRVLNAESEESIDELQFELDARVTIGQIALSVTLQRQKSREDSKVFYVARTLLYADTEDASALFRGEIVLFHSERGSGNATRAEELTPCEKNGSGDLTWLGGCQALVVAIADALTLLDESKRDAVEAFRIETFRALEEAAAAE